MADERKHALLSPSAAHRWIHCPPSARLCEAAKEASSAYAQEGFCAHELAEYKLRKSLGEDVKDPREDLSFYDASMENHTDDYVQFCMEEYQRLSEYGKPLIFVEQRVCYDDYVPQGSGSVDCLIVSGNEMVVIDLKYGAGVPVDAAANPQLRLYALGAWLMLDNLFGEQGITDIKTIVYQPRRENISMEHISAQDLIHWADVTVRPAAELAWKGEGEQCAGIWCQFCRIKARCRTRAEANTALAAYDFREPFLLENEEIAAILDQSELFKNWIKDVEAFALTEALRGVKFPGYKVVEGRSNRRYADEAAVAAQVQNIGFDPFEHKLLGVTAMTSMLGKKRFEETLGGLIEKPAGKPTLVHETDKRKEITINSAADDFNDGFVDHQEI